MWFYNYDSKEEKRFNRIEIKKKGPPKDEPFFLEKSDFIICV